MAVVVVLVAVAAERGESRCLLCGPDRYHPISGYDGDGDGLRRRKRRSCRVVSPFCVGSQDQTKKSSVIQCCIDARGRKRNAHPTQQGAQGNVQRQIWILSLLPRRRRTQIKARRRTTLSVTSERNDDDEIRQSTTKKCEMTSRTSESTVYHPVDCQRLPSPG